MNTRYGSIPYHEARLLLLIDAMTRSGGKIDGLTKIAKLDFLLRYPSFLEQLASTKGLAVPLDIAPTLSEKRAVESRMVRYKYGPWDDRYYPVLGRLIGVGLIDALPGQGRLAVRVTDAGRTASDELRRLGWEQTWLRARFLKRNFNQSGSALKTMVYRELPEVVDRPVRSIIK
jgi:hypothetical protein